MTKNERRSQQTIYSERKPLIQRKTDYNKHPASPFLRAARPLYRRASQHISRTQRERFDTPHGREAGTQKHVVLRRVESCVITTISANRDCLVRQKIHSTKDPFFVGLSPFPPLFWQQRINISFSRKFESNVLLSQIPVPTSLCFSLFWVTYVRKQSPTITLLMINTVVSTKTRSTCCARWSRRTPRTRSS